MEILEDRTLLSTYVVDSLGDTGTGSGLAGDLRYCVTNATSGSDTITFAPGLSGTITLQSDLPDLNASVAIQGPGANLLTVSGNGSIYGFTVGAGSGVQISGLTISDADYPIYNEIGANAQLSGLTISHAVTDILNGGTASVSDCTISNASTDILNSGAASINDCTLSGSIGGQEINGNLMIVGGGAVINAGNMTIDNSTISGNRVTGGAGLAFGGTVTSAGGGGYWGNAGGNGEGGGIYASSGTLTINSSTIADNEAIGGSSNSSDLGAGNGMGGGLYIAGGTVSINNSTLADNQVIGGAGSFLLNGAGYGGGIYNAAGPGALEMHDTILADNTASTANPDLNGGVTSQGHNLIGNTSGGSGFVSSDLVNVNPQLGPLQNNGGPTQTMALLAGSPAINAGDNTNAPAYDQRGPGYPRIVGGIIDIGAFEVQNGNSNQASSLIVSGFPSVITAGVAGSFTVTALNADSTIDTSYNGTVRFSSSDGQAGLPADYTFTAADGGVHTFSATLKTAGTQSLTVTDLIFGTTGTKTGINVTPATASRLAFGQQPSTTTAGQTISPAVTVTVTDPYGNVIPTDNSTVTLTLSSGTFANGSATVSATASGGVATFSALKIDAAGSYTLKATDGSLTSAGSGSFTINPAAASTMIVGGFPSTIAGVSHNVTVTLKDAYGNLATGYTGTVHFTSSDAKATLPANYTFTAADGGVHTFSATLKTAGTQSLTATDTTTSSLTGTESGITVKAAAASKFIITAPSSVQPGVPFRLTVTVEDAYGNIVTGYTGTIHFSSTDRWAKLPANYTFKASDNGVHTFTGLVLRKVGNQKITVSDTHNSSLTGSTIVDVL